MLNSFRKTKKIYFLSLCVFVLSVFCLFNCHRQDSNDNEQNETPVGITPVAGAVINYMQQLLQNNNVPGGAIAVVSDGKLSNASGIGLRIHNGNQKIQPNTLFLACSITKMLTCGALMTLIEEGTVDVNAPITGYIPYFQLRNPFNPSGITAHHCMTHSSGVPDYLEVRCATGGMALTQWFRENTNFPLWSPPGRLWNYTNLGYSLVGAVIEEMTGQPFAQAVKERIFLPAGMSSATFNSDTVYAGGNYATGHRYDGDTVVSTCSPDTYNCALGYPPGFLYSSVMDMAHFAEVLLSKGGDVLAENSVNRMMSKQEDTHLIPGLYYGYGLMTFEWDNLSMVFHDGGLSEFRTTFMLFPAYNFGVVVMLNAGHYDPQNIAFYAADFYLNLPNITDTDYTTSPDTWGIYAGKYFDEFELGEIDIHQDSEKRLWVHFIDLDITAELLQSAGDAFYLNISDDEAKPVYLNATFFLDNEGKGEYFVTRAGVGKRVSAAAVPKIRHLSEPEKEAKRYRLIRRIQQHTTLPTFLDKPMEWNRTGSEIPPKK